jgi:hypothetical protein
MQAVMASICIAASHARVVPEKSAQARRSPAYCMHALLARIRISEWFVRWEVDCHPLELRVGWHHVTARLTSGFRLLHSSMRLALPSYTSPRRALKPHDTP